jgi:hypothetical protein
LNETAIVTREAEVGMIMSPAEAKVELRRLQEFVQSVMIEGVDYGVIPGTGKKKTLLKPGSEKLCEAYGYAPVVEIDERVENWKDTPPFFHYLIRAKLVRKSSGILMAEGVGSCNSMESKYRYRVDRDWSRTQPSGDGWEQRRKDNKTWWQRRLVNEDTADLANTILKMAKKRALIDATLSATRSSELFTQDLEDMAPADVIDAEYMEQVPAAKVEAQPAIMCADCGLEIGEGEVNGKLLAAPVVANVGKKHCGRPLCVECLPKAMKAVEATEAAEPADETTALRAHVSRLLSALDKKLDPFLFAHPEAKDLDALGLDDLEKLRVKLTPGDKQPT